MKDCVVGFGIYSRLYICTTYIILSRICLERLFKAMVLSLLTESSVFGGAAFLLDEQELFSPFLLDVKVIISICIVLICCYGRSDHYTTDGDL